MERINYAINDNLKYTDFNNCLQDMSVKAISLIDLLNKQLKLNTIGNTNNIDVNSTNNFVQNFLNYSFIDFVSKFYLYPKSTPNISDDNLLVQGVILNKNTVGLTKLQLYYWEYYSAYDKASYKTINDRKMVDKELYRYNSTEFSNGSSFGHKSINNNTNQIGLPENISGWDKEIKIPICESVVRGHVNNAKSVIIKTPHPRRNLLYYGSAEFINGKVFNVSNLYAITLALYAANFRHVSFYIEKKDLERQYGVAIHIYNIWIYLGYSSGNLSVTYDTGGSETEIPTNPTFMLTASIAS